MFGIGFACADHIPAAPFLKVVERKTGDEIDSPVYLADEDAGFYLEYTDHPQYDTFRKVRKPIRLILADEYWDDDGGNVVVAAARFSGP